MKFDQYEVLCREDGSIFRLGHGATSSSYKALDTNLRTPVVLKVMRPELFEDETARKRFMREARAAALLRHSNIAQIYRMGEENGACFYAREFIEGETLELRVNRDGPLETAAALKVALQVADALIAVKEAHLVHRDIKPSNLMLTARGDVKIIDFGLAKSNPHGQIDGVGPITVGGFIGSFDYASPEQLNEESLHVSSDIYSLGVTLWFLLTGRRPFRGPQARMMSAHLHEAPPFDELADFPSPVVGLLAHMLEKDPGRRPSTPAELVAEIKHCLGSLERPPGEAARALPITIVPAATPLVSRKISPAREPAKERSPRQFVLAEMIVGTMIAVIVYLVMSRPVDVSAPAVASAGSSEVAAPQFDPPAAAARVVNPAPLPVTNASTGGDAASAPHATDVQPGNPPVATNPVPKPAVLPQKTSRSHRNLPTRPPGSDLR